MASSGKVVGIIRNITLAAGMGYKAILPICGRIAFARGPAL
jgi:hypothetical protein